MRDSVARTKRVDCAHLAKRDYSLPPPEPSSRRVLVVAALVVFSAIGVELMQLVVPTRHGQLPDTMVKAAGGACGVAIAWLAIDERPPIEVKPNSPH